MMHELLVHWDLM